MIIERDLLNFLIEAKKATYASQGDDASVKPLIEGSKQLEYKFGDLLYRDIYFGMSYFTGQETVYFQGKPIWSMVYSGGVDQQQYNNEFVREVYSFLRKAMRNVTRENPYRGPKDYVESDFMYKNTNHGKIDQFVGNETIMFKDREVYNLNYSGGYIK